MTSRKVSFIPEESSDQYSKDPDKHISICFSYKHITCEEEFSDSEEEEEGGCKNSSNFKKAKRVKTEDDKEKEPEEKKGGCGIPPPHSRVSLRRQGP